MTKLRKYMISNLHSSLPVEDGGQCSHKSCGNAEELSVLNLVNVTTYYKLFSFQMHVIVLHHEN